MPVFPPPDFSAVAGSYSADSFGSLGGAFGGAISDVIVFDDGRVLITDDEGNSTEYQIVGIPQDGGGIEYTAQRSYQEDEDYEDSLGSVLVESGDLATDAFDFSLADDGTGPEF